MKRRSLLFIPLGWSSMAAFALTGVNEQGTLKLQGDRQLSLLRRKGLPPSVIRLDLTSTGTEIRAMPFAELNPQAPDVIQSGFGGVSLLASEHDCSHGPVLLAVADESASWRLQPLYAGKSKALPIRGMSLVKAVVSAKGRYLLAGTSSTGMPMVSVMDAVSGKDVARWEAGTVEGEVSQLMRLSAATVLGLVNDCERGAELVELNEKAQVTRRQVLPGGAASMALAASGELLISYRKEKQWYVTLFDRAWVAKWTQPLFEASGVGTRTLKLLATDTGWIVGGGFQGKIFVQSLDDSGRLESRIVDTSALLPPVDSNWHALWLNGRAIVRGATRSTRDLETGAMTEFLWMPQ